MSFKRFDPEDFLISADSITAGAWTGDAPQLTTFHKDLLSKNPQTSAKYYLSVYNSTVNSTRN